MPPKDPFYDFTSRRTWRSHQHDCPKGRWTRLTWAGMSKETGESPWDLNLNELQAPRKTGSGKCGLPQGREHHFLVGCQMVSPESIHKSNIMQTGKVLFRNIYVYICTHMNSKTVSDERGHEFESVQGIRGWSWKGRLIIKGRGKCCNLYYNLNKGGGNIKGTFRSYWKQVQKNLKWGFCLFEINKRQLSDSTRV